MDKCKHNWQQTHHGTMYLECVICHERWNAERLVNYLQAKAEGEKLAREALQEELDDCQWISVDDRLPESSTVVLTYDRGGIGMQQFHDCFDEDTDSVITHWQPLPAPPKEKNTFETVAIREWKGCWQGEEEFFKQTVPAGGYVITFHRGLSCLYKAEHYNTIEEIQAKYPQYIWMMPDKRDSSDIILVGI